MGAQWRLNSAGIRQLLRFPMGGPSGDHLGQIFLSRLSSSHIDGDKDIFHRGLLGIKTDGKKVILGVIGYFHDPPEGGNGGAHGVGAAASHKPAALHHARHSELYALDIHGESSIQVHVP